MAHFSAATWRQGRVAGGRVRLRGFGLSRWDRTTPLGLWVHHEIPVGERWGADGKAPQVVDEQQAHWWVPPVEVETVIVEVRL